MTADSPEQYDSYEENAAPGKGVLANDRFTVEMARRIVGDIIERRDRNMPRRKKSDEDEIDELVDALDELEDEDEDVEVEQEEEEEEEEEEDPDAAPKRARKGRRPKKAAAKPKAERDGVGTTEVADAAGIEPRQLRMYLRSKGIQPGDDREGRYHWPSLENKEVKTILRDIAKGAVSDLNKEKLSELKGRKSSKKKTTRKRTKVHTQKK